MKEMCKQNKEGSREKHIRGLEREEGGYENSGMGGRKTTDLYYQLCVMMPWVIFQIASNHSVLSASHYAQGIGWEERSYMCGCMEKTAGRERVSYSHSWEERCLNMKRKWILCISSRGTATWRTIHVIQEYKIRYTYHLFFLFKWYYRIYILDVS